MSAVVAYLFTLILFGLSKLANGDCTIGVDCCVVGLDCDHILSPSYGHTDYFEVKGVEDSDSPNWYDYAGKILCIPAGTYRAIALLQLKGSPGSPVVITNCGGNVIFDGRGWTPIGGKGCRHIRVTGSSSSSLGGSGGGGNSMGIVATNSATHGIHFDEGCSDIEVDHIETHSNGYAGIVIRTYPRCGGNCNENDELDGGGTCSREGFVQNNTLVHHNYIHDVPGEGLYIGTSHYHQDEGGYIYDPHGNCPGETGAEPALKGVDIYNNTLQNIGMDAIQIGAAIENVKVHHNILQRFATSHKYGHSHGIAMNPGSTGNIFSNWIEGIPDDKSGDGDFAITFYGHGSDDQLSRIYNNVILHVVVPFSFYNREDAANQRYEFVHNTIYNFTGNSPVKFYCIGTVDPDNQPPFHAIVQNNVFAEGPNAEVFDEPYGFKKFYGNTNGIVGLDCLDYHDVRESNFWRLENSTTTTTRVDFVNATNQDFHLVESSPARRTGVALANGPILTDYDGIARADFPSDQGAYTSVPSASSSEPSEAPSSAPSASPSEPSVAPSSAPSGSSSESSGPPSSMPIALSSEPSEAPSSVPSDSPSGSSTTVQFVSSENNDMCLNARNKTPNLSKCEDSEDNQIWTMYENGTIINKGAGTCLVVKKNKLKLLTCPMPDEFKNEYVFVYNEFHQTIIAAYHKSKFRAITYNMNIREYLATDTISPFNQWIYKRV